MYGPKDFHVARLLANFGAKNPRKHISISCKMIHFPFWKWFFLFFASPVFIHFELSIKMIPSYYYGWTFVPYSEIDWIWNRWLEVDIPRTKIVHNSSNARISFFCSLASSLAMQLQTYPYIYCNSLILRIKFCLLHQLSAALFKRDAFSDRFGNIINIRTNNHHRREREKKNRILPNANVADDGETGAHTHMHQTSATHHRRNWPQWTMYTAIHCAILIEICQYV